MLIFFTGIKVPMQISSFESKEQAKNWLNTYHKSVSKPFKVKKSNKRCLVAICTESSCSFLFKVSRIKGTFITKAFTEHSCANCIVRSTSTAISNLISPIALDMNGFIKPKNCLIHLRNEFGINPSYTNAYRALKGIKKCKEAENNRKSRLMLSWLQWMSENNTDSIFDYKEKTVQRENSSTSQIEYSFFMPGTSKHVLRNSLPVITLDACHTKGNYRGIIFIATAITGDDKGVILAYAFGPTECYEYWKLFLISLSQGLGLNQKPDLVVISDREKGLTQAVRETLPDCAHSYCIYHIEKNIKSRFKADTGGLIWKMAKVPTKREFDVLMQELRSTKGEQMYQFLHQIDPCFWARSYFPVARYGHYTSNVAESINASLGEELRKEMPFDIMVGIAMKISDCYESNFEKYSRTSNSLYPAKISTKIEKNKIVARTLDIKLNSLSPQIQIQSESRSSNYRIYNKETKKCSCYFTDEFGYPCQHILAVSQRSDVNESDFIIEARKYISVKEIYNSFISFCDLEYLNEREVSGIYELPRRGRPSRSSSRLISQAEQINRRTVTCRICGQENHNSRTCTARRNNNE